MINECHGVQSDLFVLKYSNVIYLFITFISGNILDFYLPHLCHVAQNGKDDKTGHEAGQTVHQTGHDGIPTTQESHKQLCSRCATQRELNTGLIFTRHTVLIYRCQQHRFIG